MSESCNIRFRKIKIEGFRGRHFELIMPETHHSVFQMNGNTGKTTTIELLRWCFKYKQSECIGKFKHMDVDPAHILDNMKTGTQTCTIDIHFIDDSNKYYKFQRMVTGVYDESKAMDPCRGDIIHEVLDSLDIDFGGTPLKNDEVFNYLILNFGMERSAEFCFFDGEKAHDLIKDFSKKEIISNLIEERTNHIKLQNYISELDNFKIKLTKDAKAKAGTKVEGKVQKELDEIDKKLLQLDIKIKNDELDLQYNHNKERELKDAINFLQKTIEKEKNENEKKRDKIISEIDDFSLSVKSKRNEIYKNCHIYINPSNDISDLTERMKNNLKERGIPEDYLKPLIDSCINSKPKICQICGRLLDTPESLEHVLSLGKNVSSPEVHKFLSDTPYYSENFDVSKARLEIKDTIQLLTKKNDELTLIPQDKKTQDGIMQLIEKEKILNETLKKIGELNSSLKSCKTEKNTLEKTKQNIETKLEYFREKKPIFDLIDNTKKNIEKAQSEIQKRMIPLLSGVISRATSYILGPSFSAKLTEEYGLLLGENGKYSHEMGGYSARLVLAYVLAESLSQINPIIIDSPVGQVDNNIRNQLANHLVKNHNQVILLCLPTEIDSFAPIINPKINLIENR